ncbi:AfsA-related hotdog domain-containing protein [Streptomyces sp. NPDC047123]|uniref:AfsA-related hotdog domain-containing protein n=1 Tax=Streptomyces sp. NPDC047123 TaxID=3155622 RepID=UPI0033E77726
MSTPVTVDTRSDLPVSPPRPSGAELTWRTLGLGTMASLLVVSLGRLGSQSFLGECQWPRFHPLNERMATVRHHPLIVVESTRQLAVALERHHLPAAAAAPLEAVSVSLGTHPRSQPTERGDATDVVARVSVTDQVVHGGVLTGYRVTAEYQFRGTPFATCTIRFARPPAPDPAWPDDAPRPALLHPSPAAVGAAAEPDVMLARAPQGRLVVVPRDPGHPVLLAGRPARLPAPAVLEAGRQAALLTSGMTAGAVVGLRADLLAPVPARGALIEVAAQSGGCRFVVMAAGRPAATGLVTLLTS